MTQFITDDKGNKTHVVIAVKEYNRLLDLAEMEQDVRDFKKAMADDDEILPSELVERLTSSDSNIVIYREYRGFTQDRLAEEVGVSKPYISLIESRQRTPSVKTLKAIAKVLEVDIDDLTDL
jgi:DNA-binding XRE family transcriptional regulator